MPSTKAIKIDTTDPSAYTELDLDHYHLLDALTYEVLEYIGDFVVKTLNYITEHYKNDLLALKPHHWITEDSPMGICYLRRVAEFKKVFYAKHPEYTLRWALPTWHADKGNLSAMHYTYPNWNGELKDLPAGMQGLKDFFRQGKACYSAEKLAEIARPAFNKKPNLLLNHYKAQSGEHIVLAGETLSKLCLKFYGDVKYWPSLLEINMKRNPKLIPDGNPKLLQTGGKLEIPKLSEINMIFDRVGPPPKQPKLVSFSSARRFLNPSKRPILDDWLASQKKSVKKLTYKEFAHILEQYFAVNLGSVIIEKGDTLSTISELIYQDAGLWEVLQLLNPRSAKDEKALQIGSTLNLPSLKMMQEFQKAQQHLETSQQLQVSILKGFQDQQQKTLIQGEIATKKLYRQWNFLQTHYLTKGGFYQIQGGESLEEVLHWICDDPKYLDYTKNPNNLIVDAGMPKGKKLQLFPIQAVLPDFQTDDQKREAYEEYERRNPPKVVPVKKPKKPAKEVDTSYLDPNRSTFGGVELFIFYTRIEEGKEVIKMDGKVFASKTGDGNYITTSGIDLKTIDSAKIIEILEDGRYKFRLAGILSMVAAGTGFAGLAEAAFATASASTIFALNVTSATTGAASEFLAGSQNTGSAFMGTTAIGYLNTATPAVNALGARASGAFAALLLFYNKVKGKELTALDFYHLGQRFNV